ncbi:putative crossover junction endonuclease EME1 [Cercophora samala]|uniref:Crossover junction endonuclease EME1 n=1 Tax=Cercophora samala TaxID=330535 RepID=A0AA39ZNT4_9PEZI|nr:putative crossover junction endonuclease EME1 [Cercophora samala]
MAEIIDLLSSSPPRPPTARQPSLPTAGTKRPPPREQSPIIDDALFVSDDEVSANPVVGTGWSWKGLGAEGPATKKRRISTADSIISSPPRKSPPAAASILPPSAQPRDQQRSSSIPKGLKNIGGKFYRSNGERYRPGLDDSEDEPEDDDPFRSPSPKGKETAPARRGFDQPQIDLDLSDDELFLDDDPFRSPSPKGKETAPVRKGPLEVDLLSDDDFFVSETPQDKGKQPMSAAPRRNVMAEDVISSSPALTQRPKKTFNKTADWDPISSSAPIPASDIGNTSAPTRTFRKTQSEVILLDDSDEAMDDGDSDKDDLPDIMDLASSKPKTTSGSTSKRPPTVTKSWNKRFTTGVLSADAVDLPDEQRKTEPPKTAAEKAAEKASKAAALAAERERKRLEKEAAKEAKAFEKKRAAALAEVNKLRTDKKVSTPEMIVDLPIGLNPTIKIQAEELLKDLSVQVESSRSPVDNVVRWKRKVDAEYNPSLTIWEPVPHRIDTEKYAMAIMPAAQFVELSLSPTTPNLDSHVSSMKSSFPGFTLIYLIEGLNPFLRKNKSARNRQFASAVRDGLDPPSNHPPTNTRQPPPNPPKIINEDLVESSLLTLQLIHSALIHHTNAPVETSQQIAVFTQHISTAPYRRLRDLANDTQAGFCMDSGQVRTGTETKDIYVRMLQEIGRVTKPIAVGIAQEYGSISKLKQAMEEEGPLILGTVRKGTNRDGGFSDRAVGQAISRRVHKILLGRDGGSSDV